MKKKVKRLIPMEFLDDQSPFMKDYVLKIAREAEEILPRLRSMSWQKRHGIVLHLFNTQRFFEDMIKFGDDAYPELNERMYRQYPFLTKLPSIVTEAIRTLRPKESSVVKIGENKYIFHQSTFYIYSYFEECFYRVNEADLFALIPQRGKRADIKLEPYLKKIWQKHAHDFKPQLFEIVTPFLKNYKSKHEVKIENCFSSLKTEDSCEFIKQLENIVENKIVPLMPIDMARLEQFLLDEVAKTKKGEDKIILRDYLKEWTTKIEATTKVVCSLIEYARHLRKQRHNFLRIYCLRDVIGVYFIDRMMDYYEGTPIRSSSFFLKRAMLTKPGYKEFYFSKALKMIYSALEKTKPFSFEIFRRKYFAEVSKTVQKDPETKFILRHIGKLMLREKIFGPNSKKVNLEGVTFIDTGLRGSISLTSIAAVYQLMREKKVDPRLKLEFNLYLTGVWFERVFKKRFYSHNYSFMYDVERLYLSEYVYNFKPDTFFDKNGPKIKLGSQACQVIGTVELLLILNIIFLLEKGVIKS